MTQMWSMHCYEKYFVSEVFDNKNYKTYSINKYNCVKFCSIITP